MRIMYTLKAPQEDPKRLFLAGGITNCPDWQSVFQLMLEEDPLLVEGGLVIVNPRRDQWNMEDKSAADEQIEWEHKELMRADAVLFWFPRETPCPITLFELGKMSQTSKTLIVGTDPNYVRRYDVIKQLQLVRPEVPVREKLEDLKFDIGNWLLDMPTYRRS